MKILIIHTKYQQLGGEDTVVQQEYELLNKKNQVDILFYNNNPGIRGAFKFIFSIWNISAAKKLKKKIIEFKPDVINIHNWHYGCGPIVFRIANKMKIPVIHTLHNYRLLCPSAILLHNNKIFTDSLDQNFPWTAIFKKVYRNSLLQTFWLATIIWFHKKIGTWKQINKYICLTSFTIELFQQSKIGLDRNKFTVKPNFTEKINTSIQTKRENHFLFIGRLSKEKGIDTLLEAFKKTNYQLRIAGEGPMKNQVLEAQIESQNINYLGSISKEKVIEELKRTQALVFPSICYETFGMTIIESFSCSTPVIASRIGAPKTLIKENKNGLYFEPGNSEELKLKIEEFILKSETEKKEMQETAYKTFELKYTKEKQMEYFDDIYKEVINL